VLCGAHLGDACGFAVAGEVEGDDLGGEVGEVRDSWECADGGGAPAVDEDDAGG